MVNVRGQDVLLPTTIVGSYPPTTVDSDRSRARRR
jgi:hypothetical protein